MTEYQNIAQRYIDTWNETDPAKRRLLVAELFTVDVTFTDPMAEVTGPDGIETVIAGVHATFPGMVFGLGPVDGHHNVARFTWTMGTPDAEEPLVVGFDVIQLADNQIRHVRGFLDKVPAA